MINSNDGYCYRQLRVLHWNFTNKVNNLDSGHLPLYPSLKFRVLCFLFSSSCTFLSSISCSWCIFLIEGNTFANFSPFSPLPLHLLNDTLYDKPFLEIKYFV